MENNKKDDNMTEVQKTIMQSIEKNNVEALTKVLSDNPKLDVNFVDGDKMTPLQQAAYRGNAVIVQKLLERGADVNKCEHENDYTTLHFGALSGNIEVCHLLLAAGVRINAVNSINRTAAQLASFVGFHNVVCTINNFIPKSDIEYYAKPQGTQTEPQLPPKILDSFYKFTLMYNMHPVKIAMLLQEYDGLVEHMDAVKKVLTLLSEREMKRKELNEVLSFKFYYISYVVTELSKLIKSRQGTEDKSFVEVFAKKLLKANKDGNLEYLDAFIRESVREFPYIDSTLFRQMVTSLASEKAPFALNVVSASVNGQRAFMDDTVKCETCGEEKPAKKCAKCKEVSYCNRECQRLHWFMHKKTCMRKNVENPSNNVIDSNEISAELEKMVAS